MHELADADGLGGWFGLLVDFGRKRSRKRAGIGDQLASPTKGLQVALDRHAVEFDRLFQKARVDRERSGLYCHADKKDIGELIVAQQRKHDVAGIGERAVGGAAGRLDARKRGVNIWIGHR